MSGIKHKKREKQQNIWRKNKGSWVLYITSIICGAILMSLEIIGGRLLSPFFGGSVYVWGSIISVFLIALSTGYYLGGVAADRKPSMAFLSGYIAVSGLLILFIPLLVFPLAQFAFSLGLGNFGALFVGMLLFFLPSLGLGMVSPYIIKLGMKESSRLGNLVGKFYAVSTIGSILGTLATTFVLIPWFGIKHIIFSLGIILVLLAAAILILQQLLPQGILAICLLGLSLFGIALADPIVAESSQNAGLIYEKETMYNNISVEDDGELRYLVFNDTEQSVINKYKFGEHVWPYTKLMDAAMQYYRPDAKKVLVIGVGGGTVINGILAQKKDIDIDAVDIDPEVINVAHKYFDMPYSPRLHTAAADGRSFLRDKKNQYDVIMVDAYNRLSIPFHLTTREFFDEVAAALKPGGIVVFNIVSSIEGDYSPFFKSLLLTSKQVFPEFRVFQAEFDDPTEMDNLILVSSRDKLPSPGQLAGRPEYKGNIDLSEAILLTDDYAPVETLALKIMSDVTVD
ncbi:MAG: fused MFS/spermidine synthase [Thermincola ferriacetica]